MQTPAQTTFDGWEALDWRQRRERRFARWLEPPGVEFANEDVRRAYRERVQLLIDAVELRTPARLPVYPDVALYAARWGGLTAREAMENAARLAPVWVRFHEEFQLDYQAERIGPARPYDLLGSRNLVWPGHGVDDDTPWQYLEAEYMRADEYDALIADPSAYFMRTYLPRIAEAFEPLAGLGPLTDILQPASLPYDILGFADPAVLQGLRRVVAAAEASAAYLAASEAMSVDVVARLGLPVFWSGYARAPYDILADFLRGTRGIAVDLFRRREKVREAAERFVPLQVDMAVRQLAATDCPLVCLPLHKGADGFLSDADFRELYWPTLKAVVLGVVAEGIVPVLIAEGGYGSRLEAIADDELPRGSVIWWFDQTDMAAARRALRDRACMAGNVPSSLMAIGTGADVTRYVTALLDDVGAGDGGFILTTGASIDDAKPETLRALLEAGRAWSLG